MGKALLISSYASASASAATTYAPAGNCYLITTATEARVETPIRDAGTARNLYVYVTTAPVGCTDSVTVRKSRADTSITVSYTSGQSGAKEDTSNTASFANTDEIDFKVSTTSDFYDNTVAVFSVLSVEYESTTDTISKLTAGGAKSISTASQTAYVTPFGNSDVLTTTEANVKWRARGSFTAQDLYTYVESNGRTTDTTIKTRKNGADGGQSVTYTSGQTGAKEDTAGTDTLADGDDFNYSVTTGANTGTIQFYILASTTLVSTAGQFVVGASAASGGSSQNSALTRYGQAGFIYGFTTEAQAQVLPRFDFTAKKLGYYVSANTLNSGAITIKLRDNGADSSLSAAANAGVTGLIEDTSNTATITGGTDEIDFSVVTGGSSGATTRYWQSFIGEVAVGGGAYTITAAQGSLTLTGQASTLKADRKLTAAQGSLTLTGQGTGLQAARKVVAGQGSLTLTGQDAGLVFGRSLTADQGSLGLTGQDAGLVAARKLTAEQAAFALAGQVATLTYSASSGYTLTAESGTYALTGQVAGLLARRRITAGLATFAVAGQGTGLVAARKLVAAQGGYVFSGVAATLQYSEGATPHPNVPPYVVVYFWKRVS